MSALTDMNEQLQAWWYLSVCLIKRTNGRALLRRSLPVHRIKRDSRTDDPSLLQIHKIMAGLLDHYNFLGNTLALDMVVNEAKYFQQYLSDILDKEGEEHWIKMLETEYGGMEEVLFNLYEATEDEQWQK